MPSDEGVLQQLRELGFVDVRWSGSGMEADVYALDARTVARLPRDPSAGTQDEVAPLLERVAAAGLPFAVPVTTGRLVLPDGRTAALQPLLAGRSIGELYDEATGVLDPRAERALLDVLGGLHTVPVEGLRSLPGAPWDEVLRDLLQDRVARFGPLLRAHVARVDDLVRAVSEFLDARAEVPVALQHGDLCRENVLVDDDGRLSAVLDWGPLTMVADPAFEMSLTAGFFDMYGPHALRTDRRLSEVFLEAFSGTFEGTFQADRADLLRYRALYALLGANAYSTHADGHFHWCAAQLARADVRTAVLGVVQVSTT